MGDAEKVYVAATDTPALIAEAPTGVVYTQQVGCVACDQQELEGFMVPFWSPPEIDECGFTDHYGGEIPEDVADRIEKAVRNVCKFTDIHGFTIDRQSSKHQEAWIWCRWKMADPNGRLRDFHGVLTYENCD